MRNKDSRVKFAPEILILFNYFVDFGSVEPHFGIGIDDGHKTAEISIFFKILHLWHSFPNDIVLDKNMGNNIFASCFEGSGY